MIRLQGIGFGTVDGVSNDVGADASVFEGEPCSGISKTVKAGFWPWLEPFSSILLFLLVCSLLVRLRQVEKSLVPKVQGLGFGTIDGVGNDAGADAAVVEGAEPREERRVELEHLPTE